MNANLTLDRGPRRARMPERGYPATLSKYRRMTSILLIEDDDETADEVAGYLRDRAYDVERAADGPDGLLRAQAGRADALVVDRMLPGLDGLSVLTALRREGQRTPAIVLSALGEVDQRIDGLRAGGDDYLVKPFALAELAARIEALLRRPVIGPETMLRLGPLQLDLVRPQRTPRRPQPGSAAA